MSNPIQLAKWKKGRPNQEGVWILYQNREYSVAEVYWDQQDEPPYKKYLRIVGEGCSIELKNFDEAQACLGPFDHIPDKLKKRVDAPSMWDFKEDDTTKSTK